MFDSEEPDAWMAMRPERVRTRETQWGTIHIDLEAGVIHYHQRWKYGFTADPKATPWTENEKCDFHMGVEDLIWKSWNSSRSGIRFRVSGPGDFAKRFATKRVAIEFDILISQRPHWLVNAHKLPPKHGDRSFVWWPARIIRLNNHDLTTSPACTEEQDQCNDDFQTVPHEFGHTLKLDDEYTKTSPHKHDTKSIMSIGSEVRARHLSWIVGQLNGMLPGCKFSV